MEQIRAEVVRAFSLQMGWPEDIVRTAVQNRGVKIIGENNDKQNE